MLLIFILSVYLFSLKFGLGFELVLQINVCPGTTREAWKGRQLEGGGGGGRGAVFVSCKH